MKSIWIRHLTISGLALASCACVSTGTTKSASQADDSASVASAVLATVDTVKAQGDSIRLGSRAVRLPEQPLGAIDSYTYRFPEHCGGHEFRVFETSDAQILEYRMSQAGAAPEIVRDYVAAPNPFAAPGLWTAYDHTPDGIAEMTSDVGSRGDGLFTGGYSRGLVTGLPFLRKRSLSDAYERAVRDAEACDRGMVVAVN